MLWIQSQLPSSSQMRQDGLAPARVSVFQCPLYWDVPQAFPFQLIQSSDWAAISPHLGPGLIRWRLK